VLKLISSTALINDPSQPSQSRPEASLRLLALAFAESQKTLLAAAKHKDILLQRLRHTICSPQPLLSTPFRGAPNCVNLYCRQSTTRLVRREKHKLPSARPRPPTSVNLLSLLSSTLNPYPEWAFGTTASAAPLPAAPPTQVPEPPHPAATAMAPPRAPSHAPASSKKPAVSFAKYTTTCDGTR
jgi:hypothetical protein